MEREYHARPRDEATEIIECYILQKNLAPYSKLPSERDMCAMWKLNRTTLRGAIKRLIVEGKVYNKKGSGTYVSPNKLMRNLQDSKSTSEAILDAGHKLRTLEIEKRIEESTKSIAKKLHILLGTKVLMLRRLRFMDDEPVMIETAYIDAVKWAGIEKFDFSQHSFYNVLAQFNTKVEQGSEHIGITYATQEEADLLGIEPKTPLFYLSGVSCDENGNPVEIFKSVVRADKIRFVSQLTR